MTKMMSLIVFEKTGHVLGAFTRTADPEGEISTEDLVGDGLLLRDAGSGEVKIHYRSQKGGVLEGKAELKG